MRHPNAPWIDYSLQHSGYASVDCRVCGIRLLIRPDQASGFFAQHLQHFSTPTHYGLGDAVAALTKFFRIPTCLPCEERRVGLNSAVPRLWRR